MCKKSECLEGHGGRRGNGKEGGRVGGRKGRVSKLGTIGCLFICLKI